MVERHRTPLDELADAYVGKLVTLSPLFASETGLARNGGLDDFSPAGAQARADLERATLAEVTRLDPVDRTDEVTKAAMIERLGRSLALFEAGETIGELNPIASPLQAIRDSFDQMDREADADLVAERFAAIPAALAGYAEALVHRAARGPAIPARQVSVVAGQAEAMLAPGGLYAGTDLDTTAAEAATVSLIDTLRALPTTEVDAVGRDRYAPLLASFLGAEVDLDDTYEWGRDQLASIIAEQEQVAATLYGPGTPVAEAMDRLNADPAWQVTGRDNLKAWMQGVADEAMAGMVEHFDIPERLTTIEAMVNYPGTGGIYYTGPTDDFSRPGRMWWSVPEGVDTFHTWQERTTVYHEGVPGHHLQIGYTVHLADTLNDWRRHACWVSGHGEGWALYSERLMADLGYLDNPADYLGMLDSQRLRAARVIVDIGVHVRGWEPEKAWEFLTENVAMDRNFLAFEFARYLGWPGQAPSYKVGQRIWEAERDRALAAGMTLKEFHNVALSQGSLPLEVLGVALSR